MIIKDALGRVVSVPSDKIPKGATIVRPDVPPGQSIHTMERNVSAPSTGRATTVTDPSDESELKDEPADTGIPRRRR